MDLLSVVTPAEEPGSSKNNTLLRQPELSAPIDGKQFSRALANQIRLSEAAAQVGGIIANAEGAEALDDASRVLWARFAAGHFTDDEVEWLSASIAAKRPRRGPVAFVGHIVSRFPIRRPQRSSDRQLSLQRRRRLAASGPMPPAFAAQFTTGELAALKIVADEYRRHGYCDLALDAIAARAGVGRTTTQNALRQARFARLVAI